MKNFVIALVGVIAFGIAVQAAEFRRPRPLKPVNGDAKKTPAKIDKN